MDKCPSKVGSGICGLKLQGCGPKQTVCASGHKHPSRGALTEREAVYQNHPKHCPECKSKLKSYPYAICKCGVGCGVWCKNNHIWTINHTTKQLRRHFERPTNIAPVPDNPGPPQAPLTVEYLEAYLNGRANSAAPKG
jgi:hypothetical protein